jgi:general secretion pathway protein D
MQIRQEVSAVDSTSFGTTGSPSFSTREAETTVVVQDSDTVIIGGIIDDTVSHIRTGIPFLMDIPVVGVAFRVDNDSKTRTELLILISPYVIRNREEAREVTEDFSNRIEGLRRMGQAIRNRHSSLKQQRTERVLIEPGTAAPPPSKAPVDTAP